jgi:hypothetical protein
VKAVRVLIHWPLPKEVHFPSWQRQVVLLGYDVVRSAGEARDLGSRRGRHVDSSGSGAEHPASEVGGTYAYRRRPKKQPTRSLLAWAIARWGVACVSSERFTQK